MATLLEIETYESNGMTGRGMSLVLESVAGIDTATTRHTWAPGEGENLYHVHTSGGDVLVDAETRAIILAALGNL